MPLLAWHARRTSRYGKIRQRLKVLHVIPSISPSTGGPAYAITGMCRALQAEGIEITIATTTAFLRNSVPTGRFLDHGGLPTIFFPCEVPPHLALSIGLTRWLQKNVRHFDIAHVHAVFTYPSTIACRIARHNRVPF